MNIFSFNHIGLQWACSFLRETGPCEWKQLGKLMDFDPQGPEKIAPKNEPASSFVVISQDLYHLQAGHGGGSKSPMKIFFHCSNDKPDDSQGALDVDPFGDENAIDKMLASLGSPNNSAPLTNTKTLVGMPAFTVPTKTEEKSPEVKTNGFVPINNPPDAKGTRAVIILNDSGMQHNDDDEDASLEQPTNTTIAANPYLARLQESNPFDTLSFEAPLTAEEIEELRSLFDPDTEPNTGK